MGALPLKGTVTGYVASVLPLKAIVTGCVEPTMHNHVKITNFEHKVFAAL